MINWIRKLAAQHILSQRNKPTAVKDLDFAFIDSKGRRYYTWEKLTELPLTRFRKIESFATFHDARISQSNLRSIAESIAALNMAIPNEKDQKERVNAHTKIAALCSELQFREEYITPEETFFAFAAALLVREDEQPDAWSDKIFSEKVATFKDERSKGNGFFLKSPTLSQLIPSYLGTAESLTAHSQRWELERERLTRRLTAILDYSSKKKKPTEKT